MEDNGRGDVEPGAHFYRSYQIDGEGNAINKRNAWQTRSVLYVRLIPPGAADTVHFRCRYPAKTPRPDHSRNQAQLPQIYRRYYTQFAFAGVAKPGLASVAFDSREYTFDSATRPRSAHRHPRQRALADRHWASPIGRLMVRKQDRERWNDWGIGLLLQGDLKGAEYAFHRVTEAEPLTPTAGSTSAAP